jgi:hypothetical protein
VKITLKFRGREMAHTEFGFDVIKTFLAEVAPYGHPDFQPKLIGRGINVMISPLPRNKRAKNPRGEEGSATEDMKPEAAAEPASNNNNHHNTPVQIDRAANPESREKPAFNNNPFAGLEVNR